MRRNFPVRDWPKESASDIGRAQTRAPRLLCQPPVSRSGDADRGIVGVFTPRVLRRFSRLAYQGYLRLISASASNLIGKPIEESAQDLGERHTAEMLGGNPGALFQGLPFPQRPGTDEAGDSFRTLPPSVSRREAKQKVNGAAGAVPRVGVRR